MNNHHEDFQVRIAKVIEDYFPDLPEGDRRDLANDLLFLVNDKVEEADKDAQPES